MKVRLRNNLSEEVLVDVSKANLTEILFHHASEAFGYSLESTAVIFRGAFVSYKELH
jgi:hypothetical protein